ncbi:MAG: zinc ribbon domain-containing protein [Candidatus Thorarchaeota archaeon]
MDYKSELEYAQDQWAEGRFDACVATCGQLLESSLKEIAADLHKQLDLATLNKLREIEAEIGQNKHQLHEFTFGKLAGYFRAGHIFDIIRKKSKSPLNKTMLVDLDQAVEWRNSAVHKNDDIGNLEAHYMWVWTASILIECCVIDCDSLSEAIQSPDDNEMKAICHHCDQPLQPGWSYCPFCGCILRKTCPICDRVIEHHNWKICPFCEERLDEETDREESLNKREYQILCRGIWSDSVKNASEAEFLDTRRKELGLTFSEARSIETKEAPQGALEYELALWTFLSLYSHLPNASQQTVLRERSYTLGLDIKKAEGIEASVFEQHSS